MNPKVRSCGDGKSDEGRSQPTHVCMFVNNTGLRDPRVTREAEVAVAAGFRVTVVASQRYDEHAPARQVQRGVTFLTPKVGPSRIAALVRGIFGAAKRDRGDTPSQAPSRGTKPGPRAQPTRASVLKRISSSLWAWRRSLIDALQRLRLGLATDADIYHAHDCDTLGIAWVCSRLRSRPLVYDSHELWVDWQIQGGASKATAVAWRVFEKVMVGQCRLCVTVSDGLSAILRRRYSPKRLVVVRNCVYGHSGNDAPQKPEARAACGIEPDARVVIYQGGILKNRGLDVLVRAAAELADVHFLMIGRPTGYCAELKELARECHCGNVRFLGHKDEAERNVFMVSADLGVVLTQDRSLSYRHSLSNKIFEYFAGGLPVLVSDLPEYRKVVNRTGAGLLADPENVADVVGKIRAFFRLDEKARGGMSERGRAAVASEFNMEKQMEPVLRFYATVCPERRR